MKRLLKKLSLGAFLATFFCFLSCTDSDNVGDNYTTFTGQMIATYLNENADSFSEFTAALKKVNAYSLLESYGKYTCFIPTNKAMNKYYAEKGKTLEQMDSLELKELVYYHLIDGEKHSASTYLSSSFIDGAIGTENMVGRYIYTSLPSGSPKWLVNKTATINTSDLEMVNGVVHVVDKVLQGNNDLLPDLIESNGRFSIFAEALRATGLRDSMLLIEDKSYVQPSTLPDGSAMSDKYKYPDARKYGYTAMVESDSILALRQKIKSLHDLRAYAKKVYDVMYPESANVTDETNCNNSLNRFVAYHLLPEKVRTDRFVNTYGYVSEYDWFGRKDEICYDNKYTIEQYHIPMAPNALISFQKGNIINDARNVFTHNLSNDDSAIRFITSESNQDCQNGILHSLNNMLVYDSYVQNTVLHKRLRMEMLTFLPELVTNEVVAYSNKYNQWHRYIPEGYCKKLKFKEVRPSVYLIYHAPNVHHYLYGDELNGNGFFDVTFTIGPVPAGKYEFRLGYHVSKTSRGITQIYLDDEPCGIPIDMRLSASDGALGWIQDYNITQLSSTFIGGNTDDPNGAENDKSLRNRGYMKGPDSYVGTVWHQNSEDVCGTARNSDGDMRKILGTFSWSTAGTHKLRFVQMLSGDCLFDYVEFMPVDLLDNEDTH